MRSILLATLLLCGCELSNTPTKTASGQLYQSGDGRYDGYFATVHQEQVAASNWPEESRAARKPVLVALDLKAGASNTIILSAARDRRHDATLGHTIDETAAAEREFAKKLEAAATRLEELEKKGEELKKQTVQDRQNMGADKADDAKVKKKDEVKREMSAAVEAVGNMLSDAKHGAKEAEELASKLRSTWSGKDEDEKKPEPAAKKPEAKPAGKKAPPAKPAAKPEKPEPAAAKPEPKPKPTPSEEVFTP